MGLSGGPGNTTVTVCWPEPGESDAARDFGRADVDVVGAGGAADGDAVDGRVLWRRIDVWKSRFMVRGNGGAGLAGGGRHAENTAATAGGGGGYGIVSGERGAGDTEEFVARRTAAGPGTRNSNRNEVAIGRGNVGDVGGPRRKVGGGLHLVSAAFDRAPDEGDGVIAVAGSGESQNRCSGRRRNWW